MSYLDELRKRREEEQKQKQLEQQQQTTKTTQTKITTPPPTVQAKPTSYVEELRQRRDTKIKQEQPAATPTTTTTVSKPIEPEKPGLFERVGDFFKKYPTPAAFVKDITKPKTKAGAMVFKVGEGMTETQTAKAREVIAKPVFSERVLGGADISIYGFANSFLPTKLAIVALEKVGIESPNKTRWELAKEQRPLETAIGSFAGDLANLWLLGQASVGLKGEAVANKALGGTKYLLPKYLQRAIPKAAGIGSIFASSNFLTETLDQIQAGKIKPGKIVAETAKGFGMGLALGGATGGVKTLPRVVGAVGATAAYTTTAKLVEDGKINQQDVYDVAVNSLVNGLFEALAGKYPGYKREYDRVNEFSREMTISRLTGSGAGQKTRKEAEAFLDTLSQLHAIQYGVKGSITDTRIVEVLDNLPDSFKTATSQTKSKYTAKIIEQLDSGKTVSEALGVANKMYGFGIQANVKQQSEIEQPIAEQVSEVQQGKEQYEQKSKEPVIVLQKEGIPMETPVPVQIHTVEYANGYHSVDVRSTVGSESLQIPFGSQVYNSKQEAIDAGIAAVEDFAAKQETVATSPEAAQEIKLIRQAINKYQTTKQPVLETTQPKVKREKPIVIEQIKLTSPDENSAKAEFEAYVLESLATAEGGQRFFTKDEEGYINGVIGRPTSIPDFLPEELRKTKLFEPVLNHIYAGTVPTKADEVRLYNLVSDQFAAFGEAKAELDTEFGKDIDTIFDEAETKKVDESIKKTTNEIQTYEQTKQGAGAAGEAQAAVKPQKEVVKEAVAGQPKSVKQIAEETKILEPNVRRILGVGTKEGTFERVDKGVYVLSRNGQDIAYVHTGDAVETLPKLAADGFKADMIFLDIPYKTPAVTGGNRGVKFDTISPEQFDVVSKAIATISRTKDTPVFYMYSQARSGLVEMQRYTDTILGAGFVPVARGEYTKTQKDGITQVRNMRGDVIEPEGLILLTQSGKLDAALKPVKDQDLQFKLIRPKGYQTEKPAAMLKKLIEMTTKEGDVVLDPFAGSGVTGEQAVKAGRQAVLVEKSEKAIEEHIKPKLKAATGVTTFYRGGGEGAAPRGKTAMDILQYEKKELGNADIVAEPGIALRSIPAERVQWLTTTRKAAEQYGEVEEVQVDNYRIIARDSEGGVLVETKVTEMAKGLGVPGGALASIGNLKTSDLLTERLRTGEPVEPAFKISQEVQNILTEFRIPIREKDLKAKYGGLYKHQSKSIRVQALYNVLVATHEGAHAIDDKYGITDNMVKVTGHGQKIRRQLTDLYVEFYPHAKREHSLEKRMKEGFATLVEYYFYRPAYIKEKYPALFNQFIQPGGSFFSNDIGRLLEMVNKLVERYARLSPDQRIGSRIRNGKEVVKQKSGFTLSQRLVFEAFNFLEPFKRYAKLSGVQNTWDDPTVQAFNFMNKNSIAANWLRGEATPIVKPDGNWIFMPGTVSDYMKMVGKRDKEFDIYLIARRVLNGYKILQDLKDRIAVIKAKEPGLSKRAAERDASAIADLTIMRELEKRADEVDQIIKRDDFSIQDAQATVDMYAGEFAAPVAIYDDVNKKMVTFMYNTGLIDAAKAAEFMSNKGYASFRRYIEDDLEARVGTVSTSKSKVSSLAARKGGELDIISPVYNQQMAITETISKGLENLLWSKVRDLAIKNPVVAQRFEELEATAAVDAKGRVSFPQEHDPNVIRVFVGGKRRFYKAAPEFIAVAKIFQPKEVDNMALLLRIPTSFFTRLTTSANPFFAAGNFTVDQFAMLSQTKTGSKPIIDPIKGLVHWITKNEYALQYKLLGGQRQTLAASYDLSPEELAKRLSGKETFLRKVANVVDGSLGVLETPSNLSEIMTRMSEYTRAVKQGKPMSVAMYLAAQVTVPFQLHGRLGGRVGFEYVKSIPYFNAALEVMYKFAVTAKENPARLGGTAAMVILAGVIASIWTMVKASDKQKRQLANTPVRELTRGLYIPTPNGDGFIRLRVPEIFGSIIAVAQLYVFSHYGYNESTFKDYAEAATAWLPDQLNLTEPKKLVLGWIPQLLKPSVQVAANVKTYPDVLPIVPDYLKEKPAEDQYTNYTSGVAKFAGKLLNMSPMLIDYWIKQQGGVASSMLVGNFPSNPIYRGEDSFVMSGRAYNDFYEQRTLVNQQWAKIKDDDTVSDDDYFKLKAENSFFNDMGDALADERAMIKENAINLPDNIRQLNYDILLGLQKHQSLETLDPMLTKLYDEIDKIKPTATIKSKIKASGYEETADAPKNIFEKVALAGRGIVTDPENTLRAIFTEEQLRKVTGDAVILKRKDFLGLLDQGDKNTVIDHIIPLSLGGTNDETNLQVLPTEDNQKKAAVEQKLFILLKDKKITKKEAQARILKWKDEQQ